MRALAYVGEGRFELREKEMSRIVEEGAASGTAKDKPYDRKTEGIHIAYSI